MTLSQSTPLHSLWGLLLLRCYPSGLGTSLHLIYNEELRRSPHGNLRVNLTPSCTLSATELFRSLPLGDIWKDAKLLDVWNYLYSGRPTRSLLGWWYMRFMRMFHFVYKSNFTSLSIPFLPTSSHHAGPRPLPAKSPGWSRVSTQPAGFHRNGCTSWLTSTRSWTLVCNVQCGAYRHASIDKFGRTYDFYILELR